MKKKYFQFLSSSFMCICLSFASFAQERSITGKVSENGEVLPGVNVLIEGTNTGTVTDSDGNYQISVKGDNAVLLFSFIGYFTQSIAVANRSVIDINLILDVEVLSELVVVGYGTQKRAEVTGAIASVGADEIAQVPIPSAEQALQGRAAGVTVISNGTPGAAPIIRIRGLGTVNDNSPLIVIDGIVGASLADLSPGDIESMDVLKDASTTAIYGALGSNGVILVTTKKGQSGPPKMTFEIWSGVQTQNQRYDLLNTQQYIQYATDLGNLQDPVAIPVRITDPKYSSYLNNDTDWQDALFQNGTMTNYNLGVSGGTENSNYRVSANYLDQEGIMTGTDFQRFNFRVNSNFTIGKLTIGQTLSTSFNDNTPDISSEGRSAFEHAIKMAPYLPVYNPNNPGGYQGPQSTLDNQDSFNPIRISNLGSRENSAETILGSFYGQYEIIDGLNFKTQVGLDLSNLRTENFRPSFDDSQNDGGGQHFATSAAITKNTFRSKSAIWTNSLTYSKSIADVHNFDLLIVSETQVVEGSAINTSSTNSITNVLNQVSNNQSSLSSFSDRYVREGYLSRLNYNYQGKYLFAASVRRDASSRFGADNRWGTFPSLAGGWRISEESFLQSISTISNLKLRASWGKVGNDRIGNYKYSSTLTSNYNYPFGSGEGLGVGTTASGPAESSLKWEETTMTNIGLDLGLLDDQITSSFEYYNNISDDLLMNVALPTSTLSHNGFISQNVGSVESKGIEMALGYNDFEGDFQWSVNVNLATVKNKVLDLGIASAITGGLFEDQFISRTVVGESMFHFYGHVVDGVFQNQGEVDSHATQENAEPGDIRFKDVAGAPDEFGNPTGPDGVIDANDRTIIGNPFPDFTYGINLTADYKGFDFNVFFQGVSGNDIYNTNIYDLEGMPRLFNSGVAVLDRWTPSNPSNTVPRALGAGENVTTSTRFVEDGSYFRMKNISLGYSIPTKLLGDKVSKLRIYVSAQNLLTITNYSGLDPEIGLYNPDGLFSSSATGDNAGIGIDYGNYPSPKSFVAGIQVSF